MSAMLTRASQAVEDALASDDNHPDDIARAVLMAVRDANVKPDTYVTRFKFDSDGVEDNYCLDPDEVEDVFPHMIDAILAGYA